MEKHEIDKHDFELLEKVGKIMTRNKTKQKKRTQKTIIFTALFIMLITLLLTSVLKIINKKQFIDTQNETAYSQNTSITDKEMNKTDINKYTAKADILLQKNSDSFTTKKEKILPDFKKAESNYKKKISEHIEANDKIDTSLLRISKYSVCSEIKNKNPGAAKNIFYLNQNNSAFVWVEIWAESFPTHINHIYYLNDKKYCTVLLAIKYIRMRTWSKITLNNSDQKGLWRVDIVAADGTILKQVAFEVKNYR